MSQSTMSCQGCCRSTKSILKKMAFPVIAKLLIGAFVHVYIFHHIVILLDNESTYHRGIVELTTASILIVLLLTNFFLAVVTNPGKVPNTKEWLPSLEVMLYIMKANGTITNESSIEVLSAHGEVCELKVLPNWSNFKFMVQSDSVPVQAKAELTDGSAITRENTIDPSVPGITPEEFNRICATRQERKVRFCKKCGVFKPDRAHHCSASNACVLKMDHYCPWVANCIGHRNYKYFLLLVLYTALASHFLFWTMSDSFVDAWDTDDFSTFGVLLISQVALGSLAGLFSFFFIVHVVLVLKNRTTIEQLGVSRFNETSPWDQGYWKNIAAVLGPYPLLWFLPIDFGRGDGCYFKQNALEETLINVRIQ